jgi:SAM-dependent methyltransferase
MSKLATAWWRDGAPELGPHVMDSTLWGETEWSKVLESGRQEVARVLRDTVMRTGPNLSVLEIGCGMGRISFALADCFGYVLGTDVSPAQIRLAREHNDRHNVGFEVSDGSRLRPTEQRDWSTIFSTGVFYHLDRDTVLTYIRDAHALLIPGGQFVFQCLCVPKPKRAWVTRILRRGLSLCGVKMWRGWPTAPGFERVYHSVPFLRGALEEAGFKIDQTLDTNPCDVWFVATKPAI